MDNRFLAKRRPLSWLILAALVALLVHSIVNAINPYRFSYPYWSNLVNSLHNEAREFRYQQEIHANAPEQGLGHLTSITEGMRSTASLIAEDYIVADHLPVDSLLMHPEYGFGAMQRSIIAPSAEIRSNLDAWLFAAADVQEARKAIAEGEIKVHALLEQMRGNYAEDARLLRLLVDIEQHLYDPAGRLGVSGPDSTGNFFTQILGDSASWGDTNLKETLAILGGQLQLIASTRGRVEQLLVDKELLRERFFSALETFSGAIENENNRALRQTTNSRLTLLGSMLAILAYCMWLLIRNRSLLRQQTIYADKLESTVEERTAELTDVNSDIEGLVEQLESSHERVDSLFNIIDGCIIEISMDEGKILYVNEGFGSIWGLSRDEFEGSTDLLQRVHPDDQAAVIDMTNSALADMQPKSIVYRIMRGEDDLIWVRDNCTPRIEDGRVVSIVSIIVDINDSKLAREEAMHMEDELAHAQKLESVGRLAAGVAHEINTPAQFVSDNLAFIRESLADLFQLVEGMRESVSAEQNVDLTNKFDELCEKADLDYLLEEFPPAVEQSADGIKSIASIVRAMKDYSHPGESLEMADINKGIESSITVSRSEWKNLAKLTTDLAEDLPLVECVVGDINQVVLNMIVNAAHAIEEQLAVEGAGMGEIAVSTTSSDEEVVISIRDSGAGFDEDVKRKIFDQFFTTKDVGKGTGQGLSLAYRVIVDKHSGSIDVESKPGEGTCFEVRLPIMQPVADTETREAG